MDYNLLSIIKKEKENLIEDKSDNCLRLSCDVHVKVENGFDDCLQNSFLSNDQQETFNYDNFKEEKQSCSICSENFINSYSLYKHNLLHLKVPLVRRKLFICDVCSNFYKTKKQLQNHITTAHKDKTLYYNRTNSLKESLRKCEVCKKVLKYKYWIDHQKNVHGQPKLQCDKCNKFFKYPRSLKRHMLHVHEGVKRLQCPKCPKILNCKDSLTAHLKNCHSEGALRKCEVCKKVLKYKTWFDHKKNVHGQPIVQCDKCDKSFKCTRYLKRHMETVHEGVKRLRRTRVYQEGMQCPKCPKILNCKDSLTTHLKTCHSEVTFQCKICKSVFKSKQYLLAHMRKVHDDDGMLHHCDICGKSFKSPTKVKTHKKNCHTAVQCPKCPKILNCKSSLTAHFKSCHSETFQCKICNSMLTSKSYLLAHMYRVHDEYDDNGLLRHCGLYRLYS